MDRAALPQKSEMQVSQPYLCEDESVSGLKIRRSNLSQLGIYFVLSAGGRMADLQERGRGFDSERGNSVLHKKDKR